MRVADRKEACARFRLALLLAWLLAALSGNAQAERLALKSYTTAEGLAHNRVALIVQDSHGFIWFCTRSGLSRFDGYRFTTYGTEQGLPDSTINYLMESRRGVYWIATNGGGVCRFDPVVNRAAATAASSRFIVYRVGNSLPTNRVNSLCSRKLRPRACSTASKKPCRAARRCRLKSPAASSLCFARFARQRASITISRRMKPAS
jgi:hypothetical protein